MSRQPSAPRPSATVIVVRDTDALPEVLLVLRHARASFGASYVFPGGLLEPGDAAVADRCHGMDEDGAGASLGLGCGALDYYSAAVRELFEETGILLAYRGDGRRRALVADNAWDEHRPALQNGELDWRQFLEDHRLYLACDRLHYCAYWVTPRYFGKRYSTRFFVTLLPPGQKDCPDGDELTDSVWLTPAEALARGADRSLTLPPPTRATLAELKDCANAAAVLAWAGAQQRAGIDCILPAILEEGGRQRIVLPGSTDYPADHVGMQV